VATSMRGRAVEALVLPFSFREFLRHRHSEPRRGFVRLPKGERSALDAQLLVYLNEGGYPEAQGIDPRSRCELLRGYVDAALFRDVVERHAVSNPLVLRWMIRQLLGNAGGAFSIQKFYNDLTSQGFAVSKNTLHAYLSHLQDAYLVLTLPIATDSERQRMVNPRKAYPIDAGLIPVFDRSGKANAGHALEACVLLELMRRGSDVAWVRTSDGFEVDFLARHGDGTNELIQVCLAAEGAATETREVRALQGALKTHRGAKATVVTLRPESFTHSPPGIEIVSAAAWLLDADTPDVA
jgi:predicted AAA+ superfamily ATPase